MNPHQLDDRIRTLVPAADTDLPGAVPGLLNAIWRQVWPDRESPRVNELILDAVDDLTMGAMDELVREGRVEAIVHNDNLRYRCTQSKNVSS